MKKCPFCAEEIQDEAIKCKHCGEWLKKEVPVNPQVVKVNEIELPEPRPEDVFPTESDEEIKRKEAGQKQCPTCGKWDVYRAVIEDGGQGDWCPHCKQSLQKMRPIPEISESQKADKYIKRAWIAGLLWGCYSLLMIVLVLGNIINLEGTSLLNLFDVFIILCCTYGIYKKYISWAITMLVYLVFNNIVYSFIIMKHISVGKIIFTFILGYFFIFGVKGTFTYYKLKE